MPNEGHIRSTHGNATHGLSRTPEHVIWCSMKQRAQTGSSHAAKDYIGRGIGMHEEWANSFEAFLAYVGPRPSPRHSIDRIDNDKGYEPGNIRWATQSQQNRNRRNNRRCTLHGRTECLSNWADITGISVGTLWNRLELGWSDERTLTEPVNRTRTNFSPEQKADKVVIFRATKRITEAVRKGRIVKPAHCQKCPRDDGSRLYPIHHNGYDGPHAYDVIWLCGECRKAYWVARKKSPDLASELLAEFRAQ